jgi:hypothetical protein
MTHSRWPLLRLDAFNSQSVDAHRVRNNCTGTSAGAVARDSRLPKRSTKSDCLHCARNSSLYSVSFAILHSASSSLFIVCAPTHSPAMPQQEIPQHVTLDGIHRRQLLAQRRCANTHVQSTPYHNANTLTRTHARTYVHCHAISITCLRAAWSSVRAPAAAAAALDQPASFHVTREHACDDSYHE